MNCPRCESPMIFKELTNDHVGWCCYSCEVFIDPKVEDANRERQILAEAARGEGWRVNKTTEEWFAEKPRGDTRSCDLCAIEEWFAEKPRGDTRSCDLCATPHYEHDIYCHGAGFVRAGKKS